MLASLVRRNLLLIAIFLLALVVRLWGIDHQINTDENKLVVPSVKLAQGKQEPLLYPQGTHYPHFYHYVLSAAYLPVTLLRPEMAFDSYYSNIFLVIGRVVTAVLGAATIFPLYLLVRRLTNARTALTAAVFLAVLPIHVKYSHYAHVDAPLAFFTTWVIVAAQYLWQTGKARWYVLTGVAVGLSGAVLYTGFVMGTALLLAHARRWRESYYSWRTLFRPAFITALLAIPITFLVVSPYSLIKRDEVWQVYQRINARAVAGDLGYTRTSLLWPIFNESRDWGLPFTSASIFEEFNPAIMILAAAGVLWLGYRRRWQEIALLGITGVVAYLAISGYVKMSAIKRFLPLAPLVAALAAIAVDALFSRFAPLWRGRAVAQSVAVLLIVAPSLYLVIGFDQAYAHGSTHVAAVEWARANIPKGSTILQHTPLVLLPPDDPDYTVVRLDEVYANFNPHDPEVGHDRAKTVEYWVNERGVDIIYFDGRMVDRYSEPTSMALYPETTASYREFFSDIQARGRRIYHIAPQLYKLAGPEVSLYDVSHLAR